MLVRVWQRLREIVFAPKKQAPAVGRIEQLRDVVPARVESADAGSPSSARPTPEFDFEALSPVRPPIDFHLSSRLASVAHLNTRSGRTPCSHSRPDARAKSMPKRVQLAPKRSSISTLKPRSTIAEKHQAEIIQLLQPQRRCISLDMRIAQAA